MDLSSEIRRIWANFLRTFLQLWELRLNRRRFIAFPFSVLCAFFITSWALESNSCALVGFACLILFDVLALTGDLILKFYAVQVLKTKSPFDVGSVRVEVLIHFAILCLGLFLNLWGVFLGTELLVSNTFHAINTGKFIPTVLLGGLVHFFLAFRNNPFLVLSKMSTNDTALQKSFQLLLARFGFFTDWLTSPIKQSSLAVLGVFASLIILLLYVLLQDGYRWLDVLCEVLIFLGCCDTLWPLCSSSAQVLLQFIPPHVSSQLDKLLREALTIDGVLEFRNELFWTLGYDQIAGSLHVRVRRDANEQAVLALVFEKLNYLVPHLTVQVTKDDFGRHFEALQFMHEMSTPPLVNTNASGISPILAYDRNKHLIYSSSSSNSRHKIRGNFYTNVSSSTKLVPNEFNENDETVLSNEHEISHSNLCSTASVFNSDLLTIVTVPRSDLVQVTQQNQELKKSTL